MFGGSSKKKDTPDDMGVSAKPKTVAEAEALAAAELAKVREAHARELEQVRLA